MGISYPQFQSTPSYNFQPHPDFSYKTSPSQLSQYFTFEDTWRQPPSSNSPPGPFLLPSDGQYCPSADICPDLDQFQLQHPPSHYQHTSLSSEAGSSYQQFDKTPAMSVPLVTPFYLPGIDTNSLHLLGRCSVMDSSMKSSISSPILINLRDCTRSSKSSGRKPSTDKLLHNATGRF